MALVESVLVLEDTHFQEEYNDRTGETKHYKQVTRVNVTGGLLEIAKAINNLAEAVREHNPRNQHE